MKNQTVSRHDLESALVRLAGFIKIIDEDARATLTDPNGLLNSAESALMTLRTACEPYLSASEKHLSGNHRIFIQIAMRIEAEPLLKQLGARRIHPKWSEGLAFEFFEASLENLDVLIGLAGVDPTHKYDSIGSVPAAVLAQLAITNFTPDLILNTGTCGGFQSKGHKIAQVFVGTEYVAFHHRRSSIPEMRNYGLGKYPVCDSSALRTELRLPDGIVSSGDALDYSKEDQEYMASNGGTLKEMEAAAIGWICNFSKTPLLPVKTVTDWVDHPADTGEQFLKNYGQAVESMTKELMRVLGYLSSNQNDPVWVRSTL